MESQLKHISYLFTVLGGFSLFFLMLVTIVAVFWRYFLNAPIFGIEDVSKMALTLIVAASVAYGTYSGAHIKINLVSASIGRNTTKLIDFIVRLMGVGITAITAYALIIAGQCGTKCGNFTSNLSIGHAPFYYALGSAMAFYCSFLIIQAVVGVAHWHGDEPNNLGD